MTRLRMEPIAREIGQMLKEKGPMSLSTLSHSLPDVSPSLVLVAVGWLLDRHRVFLSGNHHSVHVMLADIPEIDRHQAAPVPFSHFHTHTH